MINDHKYMNELLDKMGDMDLSADEKRVLGMVPTEGRSGASLMERIEHSVKRVEEGVGDFFGASELVPIAPHRAADRKDLKPLQGKESDAEIMFLFREWDDAQSLYDFILDAGLLEAGEVVFRHIEGQYSVHFQPHVWITKPDVIMAAMLAYEDIVDPDGASAFESLADNLAAIIEERDALVEQDFPGLSGAKPGGKGIGNPFHDADDGKFTSRKQMAKKKKGSWAHGKTKLKLSGVKKNKEGREVLHFAGTKHPCGRDGRPVPPEKGILCWAGKPSPWAAKLAKAFGKKRRKESFDIEDRNALIELSNFYAVAHDVIFED